VAFAYVEDIGDVSVCDDVSIIGNISDKRNICTDDNEKFKQEAMLVITGILAKIATLIIISLHRNGNTIQRRWRCYSIC